ncbi:GDP-mannose 4,6-dehydratase [Thermoanaerobacterium thermosaccharolyticum]|uniref:GDP-mannose 4,6-dehydratase n=1 Tax=Thermoanaerobacterium thermosaccharolyticum TaxID=1517 RepID=UPI00177FEF21|nr:GDP-mannose 4,6-dehydratase [Thermoanaerobacterium thermosaccharolyticum]MBE0069259.1 GDP-mannose 4,6-dehydratase [Thermoanaerobacterium thermosaccharolyticum]MBE0229045.1 GDP-mannose 4,6-dehydratase [Thermoanaerobacterium thermosaccharolyticum]
MRALVIGASGFVGDYLCKHLIDKGYEVYATRHSNSGSINTKLDNIKFYKLDIMDSYACENVLRDVMPQYIFNLAAVSSVGLSWREPAKTMEVNIIGTLNILEAVRKISINSKILIVGSSEEYGKVQPQDIPIKETQKLVPENPYGISKITQEMIAQLYYKTYGLQIYFVRAFNHIGPGQQLGFVVPDFTKQIAEIELGMKKPVIFVGNLEAKRDFTDVRDVVRAYEMIVNNGRCGEVYNVGSGKSIAIKEILDNLIRLCTKEIKIVKDLSKMRPSDVPIIEASIDKIKTEVGWRPQISIEQTLFDTYQYWINKLKE